MVPFDVQIARGDADPRFIEKLKPESTAILNWLLDGYRMWREMGLAAPEKVRQATDEYRVESDRVGNFIKSVCEITSKPEDEMPSGLLYRCFELWCERNALDVLNRTVFGRSLSERRGLKRKRSGTITYCGIQVIDLGLLSDAKDKARESRSSRGGGDE
jgi:putative DNA primase/helicase